MASQGSVSSQKSSRRRRTLICNCGEPPVLRWSKTPENPGRRFWGCVYFDIGKECTFFSWADGVAETEEAEVARLKMKISTLKTKLVYAKCKLLVAVIFGLAATLANLVLLCTEPVDPAFLAVLCWTGDVVAVPALLFWAGDAEDGAAVVSYDGHEQKQQQVTVIKR
ncbi:uncharacterized protein DS421_11g351110 [Arachis hypogaea]|nr:uncharacterized protein DS421_11g351110 [Arachis hypogaea]